MTTGQPPPLPVRPRPRRGENADSYLRRLAVANHLRFSHLRRYLSRPEGSYGPVDPGTPTAAGILTFQGDLALGAGSTLDVNLNGTTAGSSYDQLKVNGTLGI